MRLNKAILHGKVKKRPYRGGKAIDRQCRNHGGCNWCEGTRTYNSRKKELVANDILKDFFDR